jgi:predicted DNA-binding transcriptional regulator AlpA
MLSFESPMSRSELARALGVGRTTLWRYEREGKIPPSERISANRSVLAPAAQMAAAALVEARS